MPVLEDALSLSARASNKHRTMSRCASLHAMSNGVKLLSSVVKISLSAPAASSRRTTSAWPLKTAKCKAVSPSLVALLASDFASSNNSTTATWPRTEAMCSGVTLPPSKVGRLNWLTPARASISKLHSCKLPRVAATCKAVSPRSAATLGSCGANKYFSIFGMSARAAASNHSVCCSCELGLKESNTKYSVSGGVTSASSSKIPEQFNNFCRNRGWSTYFTKRCLTVRTKSGELSALSASSSSSGRRDTTSSPEDSHFICSVIPWQGSACPVSGHKLRMLQQVEIYIFVCVTQV